MLPLPHQQSVIDNLSYPSSDAYARFSVITQDYGTSIDVAAGCCSDVVHVIEPCHRHDTCITAATRREG
jgi:hypothetical protein